MRKFVAGCYQFAIDRGNVAANVERARKAVAELAARGCNLAVLPEMWSCSFVYPVLREMAKKTPEVVATVREWAKHHEMVIVGSLPEEGEDGLIYNTCYVADADGAVKGEYRKIHPFNHEQEHFARGKSPLVAETSRARLGVTVCYDIRFPELFRRLALDGAEVFTESALFPQSRKDHWTTLCRARAIENQMFMAACNGCGEDGNVKYGGGSIIVSPTGRVLAEAGAGEEIISAELDFAEMEQFRERVTVFRDRLPGVYGLE